MDSQISSYLFLFLLLLLTVFLLKLTASRYSKRDLRLPPGPWPIPIIGNMHNLILMGSLPHQAFRTLAVQYGPIMHLRLCAIRAVVITSPEAAREITKIHDTTFATRPINPTVNILSDGGKGIIFAPYGESWRQMRKICAIELLNLKRVQSFRTIREEEVNNMMKSIAESSSKSEQVNIRHRLEVVMNDITVRTVIGSKCTFRDIFFREMQISERLASGFNLIDLFPSSHLVSMLSRVPCEAKKSYKRSIEIFNGIIKEHIERKDCGEGEIESLLDVLLKIKQEDTLHFPLTMDDIRAVIFDLIGPGSESSSTTVEWAMAELIRNPRVMKHAQTEIRELLIGCKSVDESNLARLNYLHLIIKETLRLHPAAPLLLPRQCSDTCRVLGYDIPDGTLVLVNVWAIGRDPKYWDNPHEFRPERFINNSIDFRGTDFEFLPFGSGRRMCPGMSFGLASVELVLASLLYHFDWKLPHDINPEELDMSESLGITAKKKIPLFLYAVQHEPDMGTNFDG